MHYLTTKWIFTAALCTGSINLTTSAYAAELITVGNHPSCDQPSIRTAIDQSGEFQNLQILVQGRAQGNEADQQGIHDADLVIKNGRTVVITGDDGSVPLSECTNSKADRRPVIRGLGTGDSGYKVVVQDGASLVLNNIDVTDTVAGAIQVTGSSLSVNDVEFRNNSTPPGVSGAAIQSDSSNIVLNEAGFFGNISPAAGGAIFCTATTTGKITAQNVAFGASTTGSGNRAGFDGGAIALHQNCVFESTGGVVFEGNFASRDGGAIAAAADDGNLIDIRADIVFGGSHGNVAAGNGGAIALAAGAELRTEDSLSVFRRNFAGGFGGAVAVTEAGAFAVLLGCDSFFENQADIGGAIYTKGVVTVRNRENVLLCDPTLDFPPNEYATMFEDNLSTEGAGGVLFISGENARVLIEQAAFIGNDATIPGDEGAPLGSVALVTNGGILSIHNSLIWANGSKSNQPLIDPATLLQARDSGSRIDLGLSTVVENIGAHSLIVSQGATARLFGVIEFDNDMLTASSGGSSILTACSTLDTGLDPGFNPEPGTQRGRFRLSLDSPMRGFCPVGDALFAMNLNIDLDDVPRSHRLFGDSVHLDAGAFNANASLSVFSRCTTEDDLLGLSLSVSGDGTSFNVTGNGPNLPVTTNNGLVFLAEDGTGGWTDVLVEENDGDQESAFLGDFTCSDAVFSDRYESFNP